MALETLQPGTVLGGRYKLGPLMGHGGMGSVYEAIQVDLGRRVAVKVLDPRLALDPAHVERFRREAHAAASLGHPNIVQVTDFFWQPGSPPFLVMEHLQGQSLAQLMERSGPLGGRHAAVIATQALDALGAAHRAGIVHRDIKPDNLFLVQVQALGEVVKLLDFGIAKLVEGAHTTGPGSGSPITSTGTMLGTPAYMAPEQARGGAIDYRADLYALGACLYHALSGGLPFSATSAPAMLFAIVEQQPEPLARLRPDLPPGLCAIVARRWRRSRAAHRSHLPRRFRDRPGVRPTRPRRPRLPRSRPRAELAVRSRRWPRRRSSSPAHP
jgi:serine/threonine-protein kinase